MNFCDSNWSSGCCCQHHRDCLCQYYVRRSIAPSAADRVAFLALKIYYYCRYFCLFVCLFFVFVFCFGLLFVLFCFVCVSVCVLSFCAKWCAKHIGFSKGATLHAMLAARNSVFPISAFAVYSTSFPLFFHYKVINICDVNSEYNFHLYFAELSFSPINWPLWLTMWWKRTGRKWNWMN